MKGETAWREEARWTLNEAALWAGRGGQQGEQRASAKPGVGRGALLAGRVGGRADFLEQRASPGTLEGGGCLRHMRKKRAKDSED